MTNTIHKVLIIGSGPAGFTAAIYACRAGLNPVVLSGAEVGGQLTTTPSIENWPGRSDAPDGFSLMQSLKEHAQSLGANIIYDSVCEASLKDNIKVVKTVSGSEYHALSVIICTGAKPKYLNLPSEQSYIGKGVSTCATCDGFFFRKKTVAVIGGGSAAFVDALYLSNLCKKVYLIHRRDSFRAENALIEKLKTKAEEGCVEFVLNAAVEEVLGDENKVCGVRVKQEGVLREIELDGIFVAIGHQSATDIFAKELELNEDGTIRIGFGSETAASALGVFSAGDCADSVYRQAITSAGQGCKAALDAERYLSRIE